METCQGESYCTLAVSQLDERQHIGKLLANKADHVEFSITKRNVPASLVSSDGSYEDLCLYVIHHILHAYSYSDTTLVGVIQDKFGNRLFPHLMKHDIGNSTISILQHMKLVMKYICKLGSCPNLPIECFDTIFVRNVNYKQLITKFKTNLLIALEEDNEKLHLKFFSCYFEKNSSKRSVTLDMLCSTAKHLFSQINEIPQLMLENLQYCSKEEITNLKFKAIEIHQTSVENSMVTIFEKHLKRNPSNIGLIFRDRKYSYEDINTKSNKIAKWIRSKISDSPTENDQNVIALCLDRSEFLIFAIFGVWKSGNCYVPIDPSLPSVRINAILEDCNPSLIITDAPSSNKLPSPSIIPVLEVSSLHQESALHNEDNGVTRELSSEQLAIIIYTSGTTGKPKGVKIPHRALANQCLDYPLRYPDLDQDEVVLAMFNYAFNAFMEPITLAFSQGLSLLLVPFDILLDPTKFLEYLVTNHVTHIDGTPSLASQYNFEAVKTLKRIAVGGEPLTLAHRQAFLKNNPKIRLYNIFGNTEGTLASLTSDVTESDSMNFTQEVINKKVYVLSSELKRVPIGAVGEICLSGNGIANGYLSQENLKLQSEKFIKNPFVDENDSIFNRIYRTGDLGVIFKRSQVELEIIGRKDLQVKVRGIRVEISEIEAIITSYNGCEKGAVVWKKDVEGNELIGFVSGSDPFLVDKLLEHLRSRLPEYMVPKAIFHLNQIPLTSNGKINRNELIQLIPAQKSQVEASGSEILMNRLEKSICEIWEEVLSLSPKSVDPTCNFFSLGGNSLLAIKCVNLIKERLGISISASTVMEEGGSFKSFTDEYCEESKSEISNRVIPKFFNLKLIPISTIQERIWVTKEDPLHHIVFEFEGRMHHASTIDEKSFGSSNLIERVKQNMKALLQKNEILRTVYPKTKFATKPNQNILSVDKAIALIQSDAELTEDAFVTKPFNLSSEPPMRISWSQTKDDRVKFRIVVYEIGMDPLAQHIFLQELLDAGKHFYEANPNALQYSDFSMYQKQFILDETMNIKISYWKETLRLLGNDASVESQTIESAHRVDQFMIDTKVWLAIKKLSKYASISQYNLLLSSFVISIYILSSSFRQKSLTIGIFLSLRDHPQLYNIIGNFSQLIPVSVEMKSELTVEELFGKISENMKRLESKLMFPLDPITSAVGGMKNFQSLACFKYVFDASTAIPSIPSEEYTVRKIRDSQALPTLGTKLFLKIRPNLDGNGGQAYVNRKCPANFQKMLIRVLEKLCFSENVLQTKICKLKEELHKNYVY